MEAINQKIPFPRMIETEPEANTPPITKNFCYTNIKVIKCSLMWTINNFSGWSGKIGEGLSSTLFSADENNQLKWFLKVYPKGIKDEDYLSAFIYLHQLSNKGSVVKAKVKLALVNETGTKIMGEFENEFMDGKNFGYEKLMKRDLLSEKSGFLSEDRLTLFCEVSVFSDSYATSYKNPTDSFNVPKSQLAKDFGFIFDNELHSDISLSVGGRQFKTHKAVLAARSPVFAAMFTHEMKELDEDCVYLVELDIDCHHLAFEEMLRFMYTEKAPNLSKIAKNVLYLADKYLLENLKMMCEKELCGNLTIETAADTLILADLHSANQLKVQTIKFINDHLTDIINTSSWQNMIDSHPFLIAETFYANAQAKKKFKISH